MTTRMDTVDVAKEIRKTLKNEFPGTRFSVKSSRYAGGSSIRISYTDGPAAKAVERVVDIFQGADFDGMTDMKEYRNAVEYNGEMVRFGVDYIFVERDFSSDTIIRFARLLSEAFGIEFPVLISEHDGEPYIGSRYDQVLQGGDTQVEAYREMRRWDERDGLPENIDELPTWVEHEKWGAEYQAQKQAEAAIAEAEATTFEIEVVPTVTPLFEQAGDEGDPLIEARFANINKNDTLAEYRMLVDSGDYFTARCRVRKTVFLTDADFAVFANNLLSEWSWLDGIGGSECSDDIAFSTENVWEWTKADWALFHENKWANVVAVLSLSNRPIFVNTEGHGYARYVGIVA